MVTLDAMVPEPRSEALRAEWRVQPRDRKEERRLGRILVIAMGVGLALTVILQSVFPSALVMAGVLGYLTYYGQAAPPETEGAILPSEENMPVGLFFGLGEIRYGSDVGCFTLRDGWLHFEGHATSFDLCPEDALAVDFVGGYAQILLRDGVRLEVRPFTRIQGARGRYMDNAAAKRWLHFWTESKASPGQSLLPPDVWDPRIRLRSAIQFPLLATILISLGVALYRMAYIDRDGWLSAASLFGTLLSIGGVAAAVMGLNQRPHLRRLGRNTDSIDVF